MESGFQVRPVRSAADLPPHVRGYGDRVATPPDILHKRTCRGHRVKGIEKELKSPSLMDR